MDKPTTPKTHEERLALIEKQRECIQGFLQCYCPSCGCDLWNTAGCPWCMMLRDAARVVHLDRRLAPLLPADPINIKNSASKHSNAILQELSEALDEADEANRHTDKERKTRAKERLGLARDVAASALARAKELL